MPRIGLTSRQSHLERQEMLRKNKMAAGLVSDRFPGVSQIVFRMTYYQRGSRSVLMVRTVNYTPADYAYFRMDCMQQECTDGGFDLTPIVDSLVRAKKKNVKGKLVCGGRVGNVPHTHASINYEVSIQCAASEK